MAAAAAATPRLGRPPTGARERILEAGAEVLKSEGYAGTSLSKVAAAAGESKALIAYHFGSKDGLVGAVGRELAETITSRVLERIEKATTVEEIVRSVALATEELADEDERIPRLYFDLAAVSVVQPDVRATITEMNGQWRAVLEDLLGDAEDGPPRAQAGPLALLIIAGNQGLALERVERGATPELEQARELFVRAVVQAAE
jgi:AcrR family transcriptional regulator